MYIRRQDYWLESAYKQWGMKDIRFKNVQHFLETHMLYFPYNSNRLESIESWGKEFGDDSIIVQPYEKGQLKEGIIIDFLNKIGIDYTMIDNFNPQRDKYFVNVGFNRDIIEIFQLNKNFYRSANNTPANSVFFTIPGSRIHEGAVRRILSLLSAGTTGNY